MFTISEHLFQIFFSEITSPYRTTITTRKSTTVTPAPTTNKTPSVAEFLDKYREMYEHGVDKEKIVQSIFKNIDIDTLVENKALFNELWEKDQEDHRPAGPAVCCSV